jgi:hypothetical protein
MTVTSAPPASIRDPGPGLGVTRRAGLAAVVVLGPLSVAVLRALLPYNTPDNAATVTAKVAAHQGAQNATLWLTLIAMMTLVPGVIAVGLLAARHSRILGTWGMALAVASFSLLWATTTIDFAALAGARSGIGASSTTALLGNLTASPPMTVATTAFIIGHILGTVLIGAALLRARMIPAWTAWALTISQPLHFVFAVITPVRALDAAAWGLTTIGFAAAAYSITAKPRQTAR